MKIVHICTYDRGGAGLCCLRIHKSLMNAGVESKFVVLQNTQHFEEEYQYGYYKDRIVAAFMRILKMTRLKISERYKIAALAEGQHTSYTLPVSPVDITKCKWIEWADVVHLHWVNDYLDYPSFFNKIKKPIVWTLHDENLFYGIAHLRKNILPNNPLEIKYRQLKCEALRCPERLSIVFLSNKMYDDFKNEDIIKGRPKYIINNSVNTKLFIPKDQREMRRKWNIDLKKLVFVFVSTNIADPNKGLDILSDVLFKLNPEAVIIAIGSNPSKKKWVNVNSVGLVKTEAEMCELMNCADYMAMPSFQEAFNQSIIEAMACGLPAVAYPVGGATELINLNNGVLCSDFTSEALENGINLLMKRQFDSNIIREDIINRFSPEVIAAKYINTYKSISQ